MLWSEKVINFIGLPRPFFFTQSKDWFRNNKRFVYKKSPVPFQSMPGLPEGSVIRLNIENEERAVKENLCPFCGIKIDEEETSIRRKIETAVFKSTSDYVPSDFYPFHITCMKQGRIYCPFMRELKDKDFQIASTKEHLKFLKENFDKYFVIDWKNKKRG